MPKPITSPLTPGRTTPERRVFVAALALLATLAGTRTATAADCTQTSSLVYAGTESNQIRALRFDSCTGKLAAIGAVADVPKPRWVIAHPQQPLLYAATDGDGKQGSVVAFTANRETGALSKLNEAPVGGAGPTHLWLDYPSTTLLAANFGSGSASSIALDRDGRLGALVSTLQATGSGPHRRQASPHAHGVVIDPSGRYALVTDLGADRVFVYRFDHATRTLSQVNAQANALVVPAGSGPRHIVFAPNGRFAYLLNELTAEIMVLRWDASAGRLAITQSLSSNSADFQGTKSGSEIAVALDGRFVYASNRGENTLLVYRVSPESGELSQVQRISCGGKTPWTFAIHASGQWMLVANKDSNAVNVFRIDAASGLLSDTGVVADVPSPLSLGFL